MTASARRIPLAGTEHVRPVLRRARVLRLALATALAASLALALALALDRREPPSLLQSGSDGVLVLDVSGSIGPREHRQLAAALDEAIAAKRRYGLVVFSDVAYEVFPPGTDPEQVRAIRRFFVPARGEKRRLGTFSTGGRLYLASPWTPSFSGGTRISSGLELARRIVERDALRRPAVLLISDLQYDPGDYGAILDVATRYARDGVRLGLVGLGPRSRTNRFLNTLGDVGGSNVESVGSLVGAGAARNSASDDPPLVARADAPLLLVGVCLVLLLLLAANELAFRRLTWSPAGVREVR